MRLTDLNHYRKGASHKERRLVRNRHIQHDPTQILRQLEPLLATANNSFSIGFALLDRRLRYRFVNDALATMNRLPGKAHLGASVRAVLATTAEKVEPVFEKVFSTGKAELHYEFRGGMPSRREEVDWVVSYFPIVSSPSNVSHIAAVVLDMTIVRRLESHLAKLFQPSSITPANENAYGRPLPSQPTIMETTESVRLASLSNREMEVIKLVVNGNSNKQAAESLGLSIRTVESHRAKIMLKLHVHSISELIRIAMRGKIVDNL
jgi:DNA-binding CsgD family transcriptional regulator